MFAIAKIAITNGLGPGTTRGAKTEEKIESVNADALSNQTNFTIRRKPNSA